MKKILLSVLILLSSLSASTNSWDKVFHGKQETNNNQKEYTLFLVKKVSRALKKVDINTFSKEQKAIYYSYLLDYEKYMK